MHSFASVIQGDHSRQRSAWAAVASFAMIVCLPGALFCEETHWSFRPISREFGCLVNDGPVEDGLVNDGGWSTSDVDRFVWRKLKAENLKPSAQADRRTLARRLYFDLLGLPPSLNEVQNFVGDTRPDAYSRLVDELLERREYGERWGRHWLDVARYSDTKGYVDAGERRYAFAFTYRDYVIRSINADVPFDRFIQEQIAADRLGAGGESLAALGFLTVGQRFNFFPHEIIDDRIDVITRGLLGLTVTCARCHDHKYDPISSADYYGLYGVLASSMEPTPGNLPRLEAAFDGEGSEKLNEELEEKSKALGKLRRDLHARIQHEMRARSRDYLVYLIELLPEHRTLAQPPLRTKRGMVREVTAYGRGGVIRWRHFIRDCGESHRVFGIWNRLVKTTRSEFSQAARELLESPDVKARTNPRLWLELKSKPPSTMVEIAGIYGSLLEKIDSEWREAKKEHPQIARFESSDGEELRAVLYGRGAPADISLDVSEELYLLDEHTKVRQHFAEVERVYLRHPKAAARGMVLVDRERPLEPRLFHRGDPDQAREYVPRQFLSHFASLGSRPFRDGSGRLELARAITDPRNPLTARVIVNRVWGWHFGSGLVQTPSDFGLRSNPPSHPELLDYLAGRFIDEGWSLKKLHRWILNTSTYRQSSDDRPGARAVDPRNRLLWRMNRRRLGFEAMRDAMLVTAGRLEVRQGGRPVEGRMDDPDGSSRTVYCLIDRELTSNVMRVFDFPSPDLSCPERAHTTVPQQALFLLNSPFLLRRARELLSRAEQRAGSSPRGRIAALYELAYAREPSAEEFKDVEEFLHDLEPKRPDIKIAVEEKPSPWRYGYGKYDPVSHRLKSFHALPHFTGSEWQGGPAWPDGELSYLRLTASGGHVGIDSSHAAVRRWISPVEGRVRIQAQLAHTDEECGDGVQAWIVSNSGGESGHWTAFRGTTETHVDAIAVSPGDTIDFIVDARANHNCDIFEWSPAIEWLPDEKAARGQATSWDATKGFGSRDELTQKPLSPWVQLALSLLQSNEFLFID